MIGHLADGLLWAQHNAVKSRVAATSSATQDEIDVALQRHVKNEFAAFERFLLINDPQKRKR